MKKCNRILNTYRSFSLTLTKHAARENVKPFVSRSIYSFIV